MFALMSLHCSSCSLGSVRSAFLTIWVNYPGRTGICSSSPNSNSTRIVLVDGEKPENLEIKPENPEKNRRTRRKPGEPGEKQENPEKNRRTRRKHGEPGEKRSKILLFLGHRSLIKNKTQTAVINILNLHILIKT